MRRETHGEKSLPPEVEMKTRTQIYWRERGGGVRRAYADLRVYADGGGRREPLVAPGEKLATADSATAQVLLARRIEQLDGLRRGRVLHGLTGQATIAAFASVHLVAKAKSGKVTEAWLKLSESHLERAVEHFGAARDLASITTADVRGWCEHLQGTGLSGGTVRHHLNALSNLYARARAERVVPSGYDPVGDLQDKPTARRAEARWLEVPDAALFLEAARTHRPVLKGGPLPLPFAHELVATFLLTGGRESEVLGLEVADVSLDRGVVTFRPNGWRRLKTDTSHRSVPLWPQLRVVLERYLAERPPSRLLFPSYRTGAEAMVTDFHKLLDAVATRAGWTAGEIRSKMFRHTYCAARLQTLDQGAPVSVYTVAKELGHGGETMVRRVYGHLGQVRHRVRVVEYRVEQFAAKLEERLAALGARNRFGTTIDTTGVDSQPYRVSRSAPTTRA
jgi:integrase